MAIMSRREYEATVAYLATRSTLLPLSQTPLGKAVSKLLKHDRDLRAATHEVRVERRVWEAPDDTYLVLGQIQLFEQDGWSEGDRALVTVQRKEPDDD